MSVFPLNQLKSHDLTAQISILLDATYQNFLYKTEITNFFYESNFLISISLNSIKVVSFFVKSSMEL